MLRKFLARSTQSSITINFRKVSLSSSLSTISPPEPMAPHLSDFRETIRRWVSKEIIPNVNEWEENGRVPRDIFRQAGEIGIFGVGYPEEYGGLGNHPCDLSVMMLVNEELCRAGSGGLCAALSVHNISLPPIISLGSEELKQKVVPAVLAGQKTMSLGVTEPSGGSDVANMQTVATLIDDDHYLVNGSKTFITGGMESDFITLAVRTGGSGPSGISLLCVEKGTPGLERTELMKAGWWCSDTATLHFDNMKVPKKNLLGTENNGFINVMKNFNSERKYHWFTTFFFFKLFFVTTTNNYYNHCV